MQNPELGAPTARPTWASVLLVAAGGTVGTLARALISPAVPDLGGVPFGVLMINLSGAFLLGLLLGVLQRLGPDTGRRRAVRLFVGTGILGGFTTYSALALDTVTLIDFGDPLRGGGYFMITVMIGGVAGLAGLLIGGLGWRGADSIG